MTSIKKMHADWADKTLPRGAPPIQRQETERAFYCGAFAFFTLMIAEVTTLPDDKAETRLAEIENELKDYFRLLRTIPGSQGQQTQ